MTSSHSLSVVIIARNEARNIARCIESVLEATAGYPATEIVLVDSASTDATIQIACWYPITILRLDPSAVLTAAAGRYVGTLHTQGELILYLDGDMALAPGWLEEAIPYLAERPDVAGIAGYWHDIHIEDGRVIEERNRYHGRAGQSVAAQHFGGTALYRRAPLEQVGGFHPYIISEEEPELGMRLRRAGYKLAYLPSLMGYHYCIPQTSLAGQFRHAHLRHFWGVGQVLRRHIGTPLFWLYLKERGIFAVYLAALVVSFVTLLLTVVLGDVRFFGTWLLIASVTLTIFLIKKRSLRETFLSLFRQTLIAYGAVRGFLSPLPSPQGYPRTAEIVQVQGRGATAMPGRAGR